MKKKVLKKIKGTDFVFKVYSELVVNFFVLLFLVDGTIIIRVKRFYLLHRKFDG